MTKKGIMRMPLPMQRHLHIRPFSAHPPQHIASYTHTEYSHFEPLAFCSLRALCLTVRLPCETNINPQGFANTEKAAPPLELSLHHRPVNLQLFEVLCYIPLGAVVYGDGNRGCIGF